jgi:ribosomal-protein-alanine N-acetyltransferase
MRQQAWDLARLIYEPMQESDLDEVVAVEQEVYPYPWSRANFSDSLTQGYHAWVLRAQDRALMGYFLVMGIVDEAHLLNVAVALPWQGKGVGRLLVNQAVALSRGLGMASILLEVRPSNARALEIYQRYGFAEIGRRKGYYPAANSTREDAIVMRFGL